MLTKDAHETLSRLARFGANITDAHGCYIFLPTGKQPEGVEMIGHHSLSNDIITNCRIPAGNGLVGWVAKHRRSIHVSPFERDSRTLGFYNSDQSLKSFIGIPVLLAAVEGKEEIAGVVACDSKKSFAFSKLQGKLLEDLACEIANNLKLNASLSEAGVHKLTWQSFLVKTHELATSIGRESIEIIRLRPRNLQNLEESIGTGKTVMLFDQICRLIQQSLPAHFPHFRLPNGDILIAMDNMMTAYIESKIDALCQHCATTMPALGSMRVYFSIVKCAASNKRYRTLTLEDLIHATAEQTLANVPVERDLKREGIKSIGMIYEYKRA